MFPEKHGSSNAFIRRYNIALQWKDIKDIESVLNKELEIVNKWLTQNHLRLNLSKTQYMVFGSHRKLTNCGDINLAVDNHELERVNTYKYLGVWMDETLTCKNILKKQ